MRMHICTPFFSPQQKNEIVFRFSHCIKSLPVFYGTLKQECNLRSLVLSSKNIINKQQMVEKTACFMRFLVIRVSFYYKPEPKNYHQIYQRCPTNILATIKRNMIQNRFFFNLKKPLEKIFKYL